MSKKPLKLMRLLEDKRIKPEVVFGCAEETRADNSGVEDNAYKYRSCSFFKKRWKYLK